jgi:hypothetical protein
MATVYIWADRRVKPTKKRRIEVKVNSMPDKYRTNASTGWIWVRNYLSKKYGIPIVHIREIMNWSTYRGRGK